MNYKPFLVQSKHLLCLDDERITKEKKLKRQDNTFTA